MTASPEDEWALLHGRRGDEQMIARIRTRRPTSDERSHSPLLVMIRWEFESETCLPGDELLDEMANFETLLFDAMDAGDWGSCVAVVTCDGAREWRIYTHDMELFQHGLNEALAGLPRYPLEFATFEDPDWDAYAELTPAN